MTSLHLPIDEIVGRSAVNYNIAADFLELAAFLSRESTVATSAVINEASIGASEDYGSLTEELLGNAELPYEEELLCGVAERIGERQETLGISYPFRLDPSGDVVAYCPPDTEDVEGSTAYTLSLLLSNLKGMSPILNNSGVHPTDNEVRVLRKYFQYFATVGLAAEIRGRAWSFGFPRPDGSGFLAKLEDVWAVLGDGRVEPQIGAPLGAKDDQIDVFAARLPGDGLPGFPLIAAQVATGRQYSRKSIKRHIGTFKSRWFGRQPVTEFIMYMVVPFVIESDKFIDDVRSLGNVLHRLRLPKRVTEAAVSVRTMGNADEIEGYECLGTAGKWIRQYRERAVGKCAQTEYSS